MLYLFVSRQLGFKMDVNMDRAVILISIDHGDVEYPSSMLESALGNDDCMKQ